MMKRIRLRISHRKPSEDEDKDQVRLKPYTSALHRCLARREAASEQPYCLLQEFKGMDP